MFPSLRDSDNIIPALVLFIMVWVGTGNVWVLAVRLCVESLFDLNPRVGKRRCSSMHISYSYSSNMVCISVLCVNGLGLTLCVSVNLIMKFIYTLCKCKCIIFIYICVSVKLYIYIYSFMWSNKKIKCKYIQITCCTLFPIVDLSFALLFFCFTPCTFVFLAIKF